MEKVEQTKLIELLRMYMQQCRLKNRYVEVCLGMPKNSLSNFLSLKKTMPEKWNGPIKIFCSLLPSFHASYLAERKRVSLPPDFINFKNIGVLQGNGEIIPLEYKPGNTAELELLHNAWASEIAAYCLKEGITPVDLINTYKSWKQVKNSIAVGSTVKIQDTSAQKSYAKPYDPNDNPIYKKKMKI